MSVHSLRLPVHQRPAWGDLLREFSDESGTAWVGTISHEAGTDYKGRYLFLLRPVEADGGSVSLVDVRWNSEKTARRTLETMSDVELRRRLRSALGRGRASS